MHKGNYPTKGQRRTLQLLMCPWMRNWRFHFDEHWEDVAENDGGFPKLQRNLTPEQTRLAFGAGLDEHGDGATIASVDTRRKANSH